MASAGSVCVNLVSVHMGEKQIFSMSRSLLRNSINKAVDLAISLQLVNELDASAQNILIAANIY